MQQSEGIFKAPLIDAKSQTVSTADVEAPKPVPFQKVFNCSNDEELCSITQESLFQGDPHVLFLDGYVYKKQALLNWLFTKGTSPMCGLKLDDYLKTYGLDSINRSNPILVKRRQQQSVSCGELSMCGLTFGTIGSIAMFFSLSYKTGRVYNMPIAVGLFGLLVFSIIAFVYLRLRRPPTQYFQSPGSLSVYGSVDHTDQFAEMFKQTFIDFEPKKYLDAPERYLEKLLDSKGYLERQLGPEKYKEYLEKRSSESTSSTPSFTK